MCLSRENFSLAKSLHIQIIRVDLPEPVSPVMHITASFFPISLSSPTLLVMFLLNWRIMGCFVNSGGISNCVFSPRRRLPFSRGC